MNGVATDYLLDGDKIVSQIYNNQQIWFDYDAAGTRHAMEYNGNNYYYYYNLQGDVIGLYDSDLNSVVQYSYDSWGKLLSVTGSLAETVGKANPFRYRGYYYDSETELYYLNSRYYDPEVGRFINADGYVSTGQGVLGNNMFAYCGNNPVVRVDFGGEHWYFLWLDDLWECITAKKNDTKETSHDISLLAPEKKKPESSTYSKKDVNIYVSGKGGKIESKVNVELMPNHKSGNKPNPNIKIYDSYKIRSTVDQRKILDIIMSDSNFDRAVFTRTQNSFITEWKIHNRAYDIAFFSPYLQDRFGTVDLDENEMSIFRWDYPW